MSDPVLEALWKKALDEWDEDAAHGAFLQHCQTTQQLPEAAARYKGMAGDRERGEAATRRLGGVALLAMAALEHQPREDPKRYSRYMAIAVSLGFVGASLWLLYALVTK